MGDVALPGTFAGFGAIDFAEVLDVVLVLAFQAFGVDRAAEGVGLVIAVFLEGLDFAGEPALEVDELRIFLRVGDELTHEVGAEQERGEGGGGRLEADLREIAGVMPAEEPGEVVLERAELEGLLLGSPPFLVAATGFPVGNIARGDMKAAFLDGRGDSFVRQVIGKHAIDQVAFEGGEVGDFAVAGFTGWPGLERRERRRNELKGHGEVVRCGAVCGRFENCRGTLAVERGKQLRVESGRRVEDGPRSGRALNRSGLGREPGSRRG